MVRTTRSAFVFAILVSSACATTPRTAPVEAPPLPFVGSDKPDPWGVPTKTADKLAVRRLLRERRFAELTRTLEAFQAIADADCQQELVGIDAFESFDSADPALEPLLNLWLKESPDSYAPLVSRGVWASAMAMKSRGARWASETTASQWKGLHEWAASAREDLDASVAKHPTFAARRALAAMNMMTSSREVEGSSQVELALKQCPASFQMNLKATVPMRPRWGGSYAQMEELAASVPVALNPKLRVLKGVAESDQCHLMESAEALEHCDRAIEAGGPHWEFLRNKMFVLWRLNRNEEALAALDMAIEQRPQKAELHALRGVTLVRLLREPEANAAFALARELDPYESYLPKDGGGGKTGP